MIAPETLEQPAARPRSRWPRRSRRMISLTVILGGLCAGYLYWLTVAERHLQEAIAEADRLDPGWRLENLEAARATIADERNSALRVQRAYALLPPPWPPDQLVPAPSYFKPEQQLNAAQATVVGQALVNAARALAEAQPLADLPYGRHAIDWPVHPIAVSWTHAQNARQISTLLSFDAMLRAQEGDIDAALTACRGVLNAGRSIGDEPVVISQLVRIACQGQALRTMERVLAQGEPSDEVLARLQELVADEAKHPAVLIMFRGERALMNRYLEFLEAGQGDGALLVDDRPPAGRAVEFLARPRVKEMRAQAIELLSAYVEAAKAAPAEQSARFALLPTVPPRTSPVLRDLWLAHSNLVAAGQRTQAQLRCAVVTLAVERYRRANGRWPASLAELRPTYVRDLPRDPFDGRPLRYRRLPDGVVIYSIGFDLTDNGGTLARDKSPTTPGTDLGYQLWDVEQRRQEPVPFSGPPAPR